MNLLFVSSEDRLRSPTSEEVFSRYENINAIGAGTNKEAEILVSDDLVEWADIIFVMENYHRNMLSNKFKALLRGKRLVCLDIPNNYERMDPTLIRLLQNRVSKHVVL